MKRTEEQIVSQAGIEVILGGEKYKIAPLVIRDSRIWRGKVIELIKPLPQIVRIDTDDPEAFGEGLTQLLITMPDQTIELFFEYAKNLKELRGEIEGKATDAEIAQAFKEVLQIAFPLAESPTEVMKQISQ